MGCHSTPEVGLLRILQELQHSRCAPLERIRRGTNCYTFPHNQSELAAGLKEDQARKDPAETRVTSSTHAPSWCDTKEGSPLTLAGVLGKTAKLAFEVTAYPNGPAVDISRMQGFLSDLYHHYHSSNPYHNFKHAFSVMSAVGNLLRLCGADEFCSAVEQLALLVASLAHDVGHSGLNNDYYVKKKHALAIRYNDQAVLESMHSSLAFELILKEKNNFLVDWDEEAFAEFRKTAIAAILATDMKVHFDLTTQMQDLRSTPEVDTSCPDTKILVHKCLVHAADISNPVLPTSMYEAWAQRVATEFYRQSQREKSEGLPTAPFMDSSPDDRAEFAVLQLGFMNFVVAPLWNAMIDMWPELEPRRKQLAVNVEYFKELQSCAEKKDTEEGSPE